MCTKSWVLNRLEGLNLPKKSVVRLTDRSDMTESESELFTGDTSKDNHSSKPVIMGVSLLTREVNLGTEYSAHSETEIRESVKEFQSLIVWGGEKKLDF